MRTAMLLLVLAGPAHAGLYFADMPTPPPRPGSIRSDVLQLRAAAVPPAGPLDQDSPRARLETIVRRIETVRAEGVFSTPDRVSLSAAYLRLGRTNDAIRLLDRGDKTHFLVLANLATAHFMNGDLVLAERYQSQLIRAWPAVAPHWSPDDLARCRVAELAFERLIRSRADEARRGVNRDLPMDPIFPGFVVETPDGDYEPGEMPRSARDRLPADADRTLMQLLIWLPGDFRLYWQLGELSAAMGHVELGASILDELAFNINPPFKGLARHAKVLVAAARAFRELKQLEPSYQLRSVGLLITASLAPSGASGHVAASSALTAPIMVRYFKRDEDQPPAVGVDPPERPLPFNLRHIAVSFAFGFLVAALIGFQFQEWRRRRAARAEEQSAARATEGKSDDGGHIRSTAPPAGP